MWGRFRRECVLNLERKSKWYMWAGTSLCMLMLIAMLLVAIRIQIYTLGLNMLVAGQSTECSKCSFLKQYLMNRTSGLAQWSYYRETTQESICALKPWYPASPLLGESTKMCHGGAGPVTNHGSLIMIRSGCKEHSSIFQKQVWIQIKCPLKQADV